jgi:uncharacterized protein YjgD (DUF1641 family)
MKSIKISITILFTFFYIACSAAPRTDKPEAQNKAIIEKNKQINLLNNVGKILQDAQKVEKLGRNMNSYRIGTDAESKRICNVVSEENRAAIVDLETRIKTLPDNYNEQLFPIITDLNECVSCSKKAVDSCVKARASVNKMIKEIYP